MVLGADHDRRLAEPPGDAIAGQAGAQAEQGAGRYRLLHQGTDRIDRPRQAQISQVQGEACKNTQQDRVGEQGVQDLPGQIPPVGAFPFLPQFQEQRGQGEKGQAVDRKQDEEWQGGLIPESGQDQRQAQQDRIAERIAHAA